MNYKAINGIQGGRLLAATLALSLLLAGCSGGNNNTSSSFPSQTEASSFGETGTETTTLQYAAEIDKNKIMTFAISVDAESWQTMLDNAQKEEYISADVTINGATIQNVGIRPKGNSSLSSIARDSTTDRYSFKIKFDEYVDGQTWLGLDKIVVNNMFSDATYMKEYLSYDIMSAVGVDAPLFAFADISVNGESWGFYLAVEDMDSGYRDRTGKKDGEMYKPENEMGGMGGRPGAMPDSQGEAGGVAEPFRADAPPADFSSTSANASVEKSGASSTATQQSGVQGRPNGDSGGGMGSMANNGVSLQYTDDEISSYSAIFDNAETKTDEADHQRVITALKHLSEGSDLETYVDVDATLRYFAAHTVVVNLDSYVSNMGHNYYLYEKDGQISILPWDYNLAFGGFQSGSATDVVNFPIDTPVSGVSLENRPLLGQLLAVPEYLEKYHEYLQAILDNYFNDGKFEQKVDQLNALITTYVQNDPSSFYTYEQYQKAVAALKELGTLRAKSIQEQLDGTIPSTAEGQKSDSGKLIDASSINLSDLGTQGRGGQSGPGGMVGGGVMPEDMDRKTMQSAVEIIRSTQNGALTEEQKAKLHDLGLTDEQITQLQSMLELGGAPGGNQRQGPGGGR